MQHNHTMTSTTSAVQVSSVTTSSKKLTRSCSTCVFQHGCWTYQVKLPGPGKPTDRVSGALPPPPPLFTLHWSAVSRVQYNQSYTQTQWQCPPHGSLSNTGIRALREPTGFRQTALRAFPCSRFSFRMALPLFLFYCAYCALSLYRSPSPVCQDCLYFWKSSPSPSLARMKQTTSAAGGLLQLCCPPPPFLLQLYNEA